VINTASTSAFRPTGSSIPYMASKAALVSMTRSLARALASVEDVARTIVFLAATDSVAGEIVVVDRGVNL
jgi:NAD(P)-dependent dehydrogenase (short-subunit alcohol dehydrogenase family)